MHLFLEKLKHLHSQKKVVTFLHDAFFGNCKKFQGTFIKEHKKHIVSISVRIYKIFLNLEGELRAILTLY